MPKKSRYPQQKFGNADYLTWIKDFAKWFAKRVGESDYPSHLGAGLDALIDNFSAALHEWKRLKSVAKGKYKIWSAASVKLRKQIIRIKIALPTVAENPPVLAEFGISGVIKHDRDVLYIIAANCVNHWAELCAPDPPPQFLPMQADFETLVELFDNFVAAREVYSDNLHAARRAQNEMIWARAACNKAERKIFRWYKAHHPKTTGEWWTATEWGASRGRRRKKKKVNSE